jgi:RHS repeat-associated protein
MIVVNNRRLAGVQTTDRSGTHQSTYTYDADGNRVLQTVDGISTNYLVDTNRSLAQVAAEYDSSGVKASYTYAGGVISQISNNVTSFYVNDGHSGVRLITNNAGAVTDAYNYDGYGNLLQSVGNANNERYRGETSDSSTGLQYLRARYYDPSTGRFLSTDAFEGMLESPVSRHRYLYGNNNPITYADPSGNFSMAEVSTVLSILETLGIITLAQVGLGQIARRFGEDIIWDGTLTSATGKAETGVYGFAINAGLSLLDLTTRNNDLRSPYLYPGLISKFRGKWLQVYGGVSGTSELSLPQQSFPFTLSIESSVVAWSPGIIEATLPAFAGTFLIGSSTVGPTSPKVFSAGFGWGSASDKFGTPAILPSSKSTNPVDAGISLKEGISIPVYFFPI